MRYFLVAFLALFLAACGSSLPSVKPYKMDIQQGNVVTSKMLLQLKPGMSKSQVRFIMGAPLVVDSFHQNRWDYFYQMRQAGKVVEQRRVILDFDKEGKLATVRGDVVPAGSENIAATDNTQKVVEVQPVKREEKGMLDKLKFWKDDEAAKNAAKPADKNAPEKSMWDKLKFWKSDTAAAEQAKEAAKAESAKLPAPEAVLPSALPTPSVPSVEAPSVPVPSEVPSVIAMPAPATPDVPASTEPKMPEPASAAPANPAPEIAAVEPAPTPEPAPVPTKNGEKLIFRMDKTLRLENLNAPAMPLEAAPPVSVPKASVPTSKAAPAPLPDEGEPGYFEKLLEKIGF